MIYSPGMTQPSAHGTRRDFLGRVTGAAALLCEPAASAAQSQDGLKIFVLWDMEGTSGIFTREQAWYWENGVREDVAREARRTFTSNVNVLSLAALERGTTELIVCDTHHGGGNLIREQLSTDSRIKYEYRSVGLEGGKRRLMPQLDSNVAGLMLPGHHAKAFTERAFLPHTNNIEWADFQINGQSVGEIGIEACYAGHWNVPLIYVEGDEAACYEARRLFPGVVTAVVKQAEAAELCTGLDQKAAHREVERKVAEAIEKARTRQLRPYKPALPMTITVRMRTMEGAAKAAKKPGVLLLDDHTVEARVGRQCDVMKWLTGAGLDMD
jgi:D-amino peptidase